ncbi:amidase [Deinococcus sp.]|uniref:amidase n=1 Tax=Deinococcus sp. TaxID=47478 RepID=UPI0025D0D31C|nr:amidase [Deinococcus sp.]
MSAATTHPGEYGAWAYRPERPLRTGDGPLSDLSFSAKDLYGVPGWPLHASTEARLPGVSDSPLVRRLLELGAALVGKTHLHEIALGITGANPITPGRNPLDPSRVPGGSSSGAAITVATGEVGFALGTDTGGSIRVPAAWCGVVGFKPGKDHPAWPTLGVLPLSPSCDHAGPLTPDIRTAARLHAALSGEAVTPRSWAGLRVGVWRPLSWLQPEALNALDILRERLERLGAVTSEVTLPDMQGAYSPIVQAEAAAVHAAALLNSPTGFSAGTEELLRLGAARSAAQVQAARDRRELYRAELATLFQTHDLILAPSVPGPAPLIGQTSLSLPEGEVPLRTAVLRLSVPFSLLGVPTLALPVPAGPLSVGVSLAAPRDAALLGLGLSLEAGSGS